MCLNDLTTKEQDEEADTTEYWTNLVDRGGLVHVKNETHVLFSEMELEVKKHLKPNITSVEKDKIIESICNNEDVLFQWCMLTVEVGDDIGKVLLKMLAEKFVTLRGFAYTSTWMEQFKLASHRTVQCSKALRKNVSSS